jgi:hypothetical protein
MVVKQPQRQHRKVEPWTSGCRLISARSSRGQWLSRLGPAGRGAPLIRRRGRPLFEGLGLARMHARTVRVVQHVRQSSGSTSRGPGERYTRTHLIITGGTDRYPEIRTRICFSSRSSHWF